MACEVFFFSCFADVVGVAEEVFVYVVCVSEGVECIIAKCVDDEGAIGEYLENWCLFVHVYGEGDGSKFRSIDDVTFFL